MLTRRTSQSRGLRFAQEAGLPFPRVQARGGVRDTFINLVPQVDLQRSRGRISDLTFEGSERFPGLRDGAARYPGAQQGHEDSNDGAAHLRWFARCWHDAISPDCQAIIYLPISRLGACSNELDLGPWERFFCVSTYPA